MYKCLSPGAIRVTVRDTREGIEAAKLGGFEGLEIGPASVADLIEKDGADAARELFRSQGIKPGAFGLPVEWRKDDEAWRKGLDALPRLAAAAQAVGCTRTATWVLSGSNDREFDENYGFHVERFKPIAAILADNGISLGLEFLGPKTLRDSFTHPFIYKMGDMLALGAEIGPNVGLLLDCWHWYTTGATVDEIRALRPEQVVYVHVNDAPAGVAVEEQVDNVRALPGETGVIDIAGFLGALQQIGYDGPVTPEPFAKGLAEYDSDGERLHVVGAAMDRIFVQAGLREGGAAG